MTVYAIILIITGLLLIGIRARLAIFGKSASAEIIGYSSPTNGIRGAAAYNYKVKYEYNGKQYIAKALESTAVFKGSAPYKNLYRKVTVRFIPKNPEKVSIKEFNSITTAGFVILVSGCVIFFI